MSTLDVKSVVKIHLSTIQENFMSISLISSTKEEIINTIKNPSTLRAKEVFPL